MAQRKTGSALRRLRPRKSGRKRTAAKNQRALELVVAALAHDIRTPLTGILAMSEMLAKSSLGDRERAWMTALHSNAEHLAALTTLFVDAARVGRRGQAPRRDPFDPRVLVQSVADSLTARAQAAELSCNIDIAPNLPVRVLGDAVRLRAALENLVDNAVKFTKQGAVALGVAAKAAPRNRMRLIFTVSDSGIGLTPAEIKRLFRPFAQANPDVVHKFGGTGLGLALVKRLAVAMGGGLAVESRAGSGSTFRLTVMVETAEGDVAQPDRASSERP
jgi:two-component system, sensor histidine kinase